MNYLKFKKPALFIAFIFCFHIINAADISSNGSGGGDWSSTNTWNGDVVPSAGDNVLIQSGDEVSIMQDIANSPNNLSITGVLTFGSSGSFSLTVSGDLTINTGGILNVEADGVNTNFHSLNLSGNFTNNGTFTANAGDDEIINVSFQATADVSLSSTSQTDFQGLTINLTTGKTLDITSVITFPDADDFTLTSGIFKLSSASTITPFSGTSDINSNSGFYLNHTSAVVNQFTSSGSLEVNGTLQIDNGIMTIGSTKTNKIDINGSSAQFTMNGGTLNITGYWNQVGGGDAEITGGTINVNNVGNQNNSTKIFYCPSTCDFVMSGGTLEIKNGNIGSGTEFYFRASGGTSITGGDIKISNTIGKTVPIIDCQTTLNNFECNVGSGNTLKCLENFTINGNFTISSGVFQLDPGIQLTVNGTTSLNGAESLILKSNITATASFINNGSISKAGTAKVERHITAYTAPDDGWHLLSSPVSNFSINGSDFAPGDNDDFYRWDEANTIWENWKPGNVFTSFDNGKGYLVAYETTSVKEFIGNLNSSDITFSDLSITGGVDNGWHLLGNPFPSALIWNDANWTITNFSGVAKIWNESAGNYTSIEADDFIPATQGFFVQASNSTNEIIIPEASRTHNSTNFYKNSFDVSEKLELIATGDINAFSDKCIVGFRENASLGYDLEFDSHKLFGSENAPQLYSIISDEENLSINYLPQSSKNNTVHFGFEIGISGIYFIEANNLDNFDTLNQIILEDFLTGDLHDFRQDSIYSFYADIDDDNKRFLLHFKNFTKINEKENPGEIQVWAHGKNIYIKNKSTDNTIVYYYVCDILGQEIIRGKINGKSDIIIPMKVKTGNYIIRITGNINYSKKLFLN